MVQPFQGFKPEALRFLRSVRKENSKTWFESRRERYESLLLDPFRSLVQDLTETMLEIDGRMELRPSINKTISRIYRDTRFSQDKSLYRDRMWFVFKRPLPNWSTEVFGYYFEIRPDGYRYGMGYYSASKETMSRFRTAIAEKPDAFRKAAGFLNREEMGFKLYGDWYKRPPQWEGPEDLRSWASLKTFHISCDHEPDEVLFSPGLVHVLCDGFQIMAPLYRFAVSLPPMDHGNVSFPDLGGKR